MTDLLLGLFIWLITSSPFILGGLILYFVKVQKLKHKIQMLEFDNKSLLNNITSLEAEILTLNDKISNLNNKISEQENLSQKPNVNPVTPNFSASKILINTTPIFAKTADTKILFDTEDFIQIEIEKKIIELNPKAEKFVLNDEKLLDDIVYFIIEDKTTNRLGSKFNITYNHLQIVLRDLQVLKLIKENPSGAYGYIPSFTFDFEYEHYKRSYNLFKYNLIKYNERIENEAENKYKEVKAQNDRWEALEEERKKEEIRLKLLNQRKQKELQNKVKNEMVENGLLPSISVKRREKIPQDVKDAVWNRDGGKCVECGSKEKLEFDHIVPFSKGGSNTIRNLQLLCETCNRQKSNKIG